MNLEAGIVSSSAKSFQFDKSVMVQQKIKKHKRVSIVGSLQLLKHYLEVY